LEIRTDKEEEELWDKMEQLLLLLLPGLMMDEQDERMDVFDDEDGQQPLSSLLLFE
jgi:hypothetical protein